MSEYNAENVKRLIKAAIKLNLSIDVSQQINPKLIPLMNELENAIADLIGKQNARRLNWESKIKKTKLVEIIREEIQKVLKESSFPNADTFRDPTERVRKDVMDEFMNAMRKALKNHDTSINSGLDKFTDLNDTEFEQLRKDAEKNGWKLKQADDNYQTTSYYMTKLRNMGEDINEFITSGNELEVLDNAARDINKDFFHNRGEYNPSLYQMVVRDSAEEVLKNLERKTDVKERGKGFTAKEDEAREYYELPGYNIAISFNGYRVSRGTTIQFLNFDGELPEKKGMYN